MPPSKAITIEIICTHIDEAVETILESVKDYFFKDLDDIYFPLQIESEISDYLCELRDDLYCVIEYPYVDKVFRNSFYNYYSSKHYTYHRDCIRVSLFNTQVKTEHFLNPNETENLRQHYLGYFIVRPTTNSVIGRSTIDPKAFSDTDFKIIKCKMETNVAGIKFITTGFPHSSQDGETMKCAETSIWSIMEYFGSKYHEYLPTFPNEIHRTLKRFSYQRQLPSTGLAMDQISFALREFGFGTKIYFSKPFMELKEIIDSYIESGIPILAGLQSGELGHVIIILGKQYCNFKWRDVPKSHFQSHGKEVSYYDASNIPNKYVVHDDNLIPYRIIDLAHPGQHYIDEEYKDYVIDGIVVPLYPKIYLESVVAKELVFQILKDNSLGYDFSNNFVFRFYLTSSRSFKNHIVTLTEMNQTLRNNLQLSRMPKFIWCAEIYDTISFKTQQTAKGIVVLDATEANQDSIDALIFAGYPDRCIIVNENNFVTLQQIFNNYKYFSNLN